MNDFFEIPTVISASGVGVKLVVCNCVVAAKLDT